MADPFGLAVRFALYLTLGLLFGLPAFAAQAHVRTLRLGLVLPGLAIVAAALSLLQLLLLAASMSGANLSDIDRATVAGVLSAGALGLAWKVRMIALAAALVAAFAQARTLWPSIAAGAVALGTLVWAGHGTMGDDMAGWLHILADLLHLMAAGLWLSALVGLAVLVFRPAAGDEHLVLCARALIGFARTGTVIVATLVLTGLVNIWVLVGPSGIATSLMLPYGRLLLTKLAIFAAMLGLAAANRFRLAPALARSIDGDPAGAMRHLRISLAVETGCIVAIFALVGWLGMLPPTGDA